MDNTIETISALCRVPAFTPADIAALMFDLDVEEKAFAVLMNVEPITVRLWLNSVSRPGSTARRLMQIYRNAPCVLDCISDSEDEEVCH